MPYRATTPALAALLLAVSVLIAGPATAQTDTGRGPPPGGAAPLPERPRAIPEPLEPDRRSGQGTEPGREDADEDSRFTPFNQGCPDRGNKLELIV
jgi:hypothetical protein